MSETSTEHFTEAQLEIVEESKAVSKNGKKTKVLTAKQKAFLAALSNEANGDIRTAMKLAGYSDQTRPDEVVGSLHEEIVEISSKLIASHSVKAVSKLIGVLDNPANPGNKDIIAAAKELLDRAGVMKKDPNSGSTNIKTDAVFILPPKDSK